jgi:NADH:ubiquinone reductase (H+-translocating)
VLRGQRNVEVLLAEVTGFDVEGRSVAITAPDGRVSALAYDTLIVATGVDTSYFGHDEWEEVAPGLKTLEDARWVRTHILGAFELAELSDDDEARRAWLTFVVVGAGPTGVELTGEIATLARRILPRDFARIDTHDARIVLLDAGPAVLPTFPEKLQRRAARDLAGWDVEIVLDTAASAIDNEGVEVRHADGSAERIAARTVIWAAGVKAAAPAAALAAAAGAATDRIGRILVEADLTLPGRPEIFAIGDMAAIEGLPGIAPVATQQGRYVGGVVAARRAGRPAPPAFRYKDKGTMATVGPRKAVVDAFGLQVGGLLGSLMWAFVHVMYLIGWGNRLVTVLRWLFQITTHNRGQRLVDVEHAAEWGSSRAPRVVRERGFWERMRDKGE